MDVSRICPFFVISLSSNIKIRNCSIFWNLGDYFTEKTVYAIKLINVFLDTNYILASWVWRPCCLTPAIDEIHIIPEKYRQLDLTAWIRESKKTLIYKLIYNKSSYPGKIRKKRNQFVVCLLTSTNFINLGQLSQH